MRKPLLLSLISVALALVVFVAHAQNTPAQNAPAQNPPQGQAQGQQPGRGRAGADPYANNPAPRNADISARRARRHRQPRPQRGAAGSRQYRVHSTRRRGSTAPLSMHRRAPKIWNPAKLKMMQGGKVTGGTLFSATDPATYCAMANAGYDFIWTEMQHDQRDWDQAARMWRTCPTAKAVPGARVAYTDEREIQHALDAGALVIVVPTVDTVAEAIEARNWTYFPPLGRRSNGGGQAFDGGDVGRRARRLSQTINDNIVLILMIETLEGLKNADEIAKVPGVTALFAASGDLGNFSGFRQGTPDYERAINIVHDATLKSGLLCGPIAWRDRPDFTCFQAGSETAAIARGVAAELGPLANTQAQPEVGPFAT